MENILENQNIQKLKLRAGEYIDNDTIYSLRGTKALMLESIDNTDKEYNNREDWGELVIAARKRKSWYSAIKQIEVTTWSSLVRNAIDTLKEQLERTNLIINSDEFKATFESCLNDILTRQSFKLNYNCPKRLYKETEETDLIKSSVYMNNKNHFIPIITDEEGIVWGLCAVYTGEIIIMLEALLDTIHYMITEYRPDIKDTYTFTTFIITYINREDIVDEQHQISREEQDEINDEVIGIDDEIERLELSKEVIRLQGKVAKMHSLAMEIYSDIEEIQNKYNLATLDDIMKLSK